MNYHSDEIGKVRRLGVVKVGGGDGEGQAWILGEESGFRELGRAYFDVARAGEERVRRAKRRGVVMGRQVGFCGGV